MNATYKYLAKFLNPILARFGVVVTRYPLPAERRRTALIMRHLISVVVDIGANAGQYGLRLRRNGYLGQIISYEPLPIAYTKLLGVTRRDRAWQAINKAVGSEPGEVMINVANNSESSSILPMLRRHVEAAPNSHTTSTVATRVVTLDSILSQFRTDERPMVKIDAQGYEKKILQGSRSLQTSVALVEVELSLVPLYEGQALFREIDSMMVSMGFILVSLEEGFFDEQSGELLQMDAIYSNSKFVSNYKEA